MGQYNFTKQHLYGENHQHITKIIERLQATSIEELFIRKFYASVPMLEPSEDDYDLFAKLVKNAFSFINKRDTHNKIKIYQGSSKSLETDHTIIEILSDDIPFLFDSVICLLNRYNIEVETVSHPLINVMRDEDGNLSSIGTEGKKELLIQIRTAHSLETETAKKLEKDLRRILNLVKHAVQDWKLIIKELNEYNSALPAEYLKSETEEFLRLMENQYFVFLGSIKYLCNNNEVLIHQKKSVLGVLKEELEIYEPLFFSTIFDDNFFTNKSILQVGKLSKISEIHRESNVDYLCLKKFDQNNNLSSVFVFIGLFTSILYYQSATLIPIIRGKLNYILKKAEFSSHSYSGKELVSIVEAFPRDELFQTTAEKLFPLIMEVYALLFKPELRIFLRKQGHTLSCLLFLPIDLANKENLNKIKAILTFEYGNVVSRNFTQINHTKLCYYHFLIDSGNLEAQQINSPSIEDKIRLEIKPWEDSLYDFLHSEYKKTQARDLFENFKNAFPIAYKENYLPRGHIINDLTNVMKFIKSKQTVFEIIPKLIDKPNIGELKIYHNCELELSSIMPMIQNMGLEVIAEQIHVIQPLNQQEVWLHKFLLKLENDSANALENAKKNVEEAFLAIWSGACQNDIYNKLISRTNLSYRQVTLLRALSEYLYQVKIGYSREYIGFVLDKHSNVAQQIIDLFYAKFSSNIRSEERLTKTKDIHENLEKLLTIVTDNVEDQIIRRLVDLVDNILRTNYFLKDNHNNFKEFISIKINSTEVQNIPLPRPYREIFVYSTNFEGIHLRGGKVSRGGLRWSDRFEDYRTEVLGLMKTQVVKNSVIVPTGAKGGFILKNTANLNREELQAKAIDCYKNFLRGLLDITDNIIDNKTHHPKHVVRYDDEDPYLVVAADKGTATFSDIANSISAEYNFWLGDAFASGGSKGYDHKKMAITAKGAWISVVRHFRELNKDIENENFTVIGIGDMSGDVFGNGMLLSKKIQLIGAFNHIHIFIDPNPDSETSFLERKRLFEMPRSSWLDYDSKILSPGARIYDRKAKTLELTPEIKSRFGLSQDLIKPDELIKVLLKAEVDLLWNGGIGTYVKASFETNEQVGDKSNDNLRCNGSELRCRIVGEGGNLGFTQFGRIEYARKGGRLNTDAIDNSAGVDCSDHEVNIKIALHQAINKGLLTEVEREKLLEEMTNEVANLVLKDNRTQTRAISIAAQQGFDILSQQEHFVDVLEEQEILDRKLECLPTKQQFSQLYSNNSGLTRPELSVLLAYSKNAVYNNLIESKLAEEEYFQKELLNYFPEQMQEKFKEIILNHPLKKEIITTAITNTMINRVDTFYLHLSSENTGHKFSDIARAYSITVDLFDLMTIWKEINSLDGKVTVADQVKLYIFIKKFIMRSTSWLLRNYHGRLDITKIINDYRGKIEQLREQIHYCLTGSFKANYEYELERLKTINVPDTIIQKIAFLSPLSSAYNIVNVANKYKTTIPQVCSVYFEIGNRFSISWLRTTANSLIADSSWKKLAIRGFKDELYDVHRKITSSVVELIIKNDETIEKWYQKNEKHIKLFDKFINEIKAQSSIEFEMIDLSLKKLSIITNK